MKLTEILNRIKNDPYGITLKGESNIEGLPILHIGSSTFDGTICFIGDENGNCQLVFIEWNYGWEVWGSVQQFQTFFKSLKAILRVRGKEYKINDLAHPTVEIFLNILQNKTS